MDKSAKILLAMLMVVSMAVLAYGINLPYAGQHDWNSAVYANIARNHLRYGLLQTKLGMVTNYDYPTADPFAYFTHYPPLMPLLVALSFSLFGVSEWAGRLVPIISSLIMILFLFKISHYLWGKTTAVLTGLFAALSPMLIYYSKIPVHETVVLGFLAFTFWHYVQFIGQRKSSFKWLIIGIILSQTTSWPGFYLSLYLPLHTWLFKRDFFRKNFTSMLAIFAIAPILFIAHNLHMYALDGSKAQISLWQAMLFRLNIGKTATAYGLTLNTFLSRQSRWIVIYFTRIMSALVFIWLTLFISRRISKIKINLPESFLLLLLVFGLTHNLIFRNLAFIHDYMLIYALPFFAMTSGVILGNIYRLLRRRTILATSIAVLIMIFFATERLAYTKALFNSGKNNPGYPLGVTLNRMSQPGDYILVLSPQFIAFYDVFIRYYADRVVGPAYELLPQDLEHYSYIVIPKSHDYVSAKDKKLLYDKFPYVETKYGVIFTLKK